MFLVLRGLALRVWDVVLRDSLGLVSNTERMDKARAKGDDHTALANWQLWKPTN
jgi:hypothetical protein